MNEKALNISNFCKEYDGFRAAKDISFSIEKGGFTGLLGLNGSGKSTTLNTIAGLNDPTSGTIEIFGHNVITSRKNALSRLGSMPQSPAFSTFDRIEEGLIDHACLYGKSYHEAKEKISMLLRVTGLAHKRDKYMRELSGGMQQRVMLTMAMCSDPDLLVLDEPTSGVDLKLTEQIWEYIDYLNDKGTSILLTTNVIDSLTRRCRELVFLKEGSVVKKLKEKDTKDLFDKNSYEIDTKVPMTDNDIKSINARSLKAFRTTCLRRNEDKSVELSVPSSQTLSSVIDATQLTKIEITSIRRIDQIKSVIQNTLVDEQKDS